MARDREGRGMTKKSVIKDGDKVKADDMVTIVTSGGKHLKAGTKKVHKVVADKLVAKGLAEIVTAMILFALLAFAPMATNAQGVLKNMYSSFGTSSLADTVVNTGTAYLSSPEIRGQYKTITVTAVGTEISGTTGGSLVLQGSLDGLFFVTLTNTTTVPNITAKTATDVATDQVWEWQVKDSPFIHYRVLWTGTGTMSARLRAGKLLAH